MKEYVSAELQLIRIAPVDILTNSGSILNPSEPEIPVVTGDEGLDGDL